MGQNEDPPAFNDITRHCKIIRYEVVRCVPNLATCDIVVATTAVSELRTSSNTTYDDTCRYCDSIGY